MKTIIKTVLICLLALVVAAFAAPFLFKDKIIAKVKSVVNKNLNARVNFDEADISFFRRFPRVSLALNNLQVTGINEFAADTLIAAKNLDVALNLVSVIKGNDMKIYAITLESPRIHAIVNKDGKANWDIIKQDASIDTAGEEKPFNMELQHYSIRNGYISYKDEKGNVSSEILNLNHEGSGDFSSDQFILKTTTTTDAVNVNMGNIPYLVNAKTDLNADVQVNNKTNTYQFETNRININNLNLATKGFFQLVDDSTYKMDISFNAPSNEFKNILSLIPVMYKNDFEKIKTSGTAVFNGFVKGTYSANQVPAYKVNLDIKDGFFQYADLPKPVRNINIEINVDNPDGITDHTVVNIPKGHFEMDKEPFDFRLLLKNPVSDMFIDAAAKGRLDFSQIVQFVKLETGTKLSGLLQADISARGAISAIEQQRYEQFLAEGTLAVSGLQYASNDYPDGIKLNNLFLTFNPKDVSVSDADGQYKKTNFSANGTISNLLPYVLRNKELTGTLNIKADLINLNDWMGVPADTSVKNTPAAPPFAVPANLDISINSLVGRLLYDQLDMKNISGNMTINNETVMLNNIRGEALDGTMVINGSYSTRESKKKPGISLKYEVKDFDVQKTFYAFNTVQKLMPVGQYLSGKLSSQLNMTGNLGDNMMPDLGSLTGQGNLLLIEGLLKKFEPLEKLAALLNVNELREIAMKEVKNYIEFTNGKVLVKPFTIKVKDIEMEVGGMHGFDQSLDYLINLKIPRVLMGDKGNAFVNNLITQVNQKGIPLSVGETVNLHVDMRGFIKNPVFSINLKEAAANTAEQLKQQALAFAQSRIDSTKNIVKDTAISIGRQLGKDLQEELRKKAFGNKDSAQTNALDSSRKKLENAGKGILDNLFKPRKAATDSTKK